MPSNDRSIAKAAKVDAVMGRSNRRSKRYNITEYGLHTAATVTGE